jgi:acetyl esterase
VANNGASLRIDPLRLAVAGDSVGGNMAAAVALMAEQRRGPKIAFQVLFYPVTDAGFDTPLLYPLCGWAVVDQARYGMVLGRLPAGPRCRKQPTATPLNAAPDRLASLPESPS